MKVIGSMSTVGMVVSGGGEVITIGQVMFGKVYFGCGVHVWLIFLPKCGVSNTIF